MEQYDSSSVANALHRSFSDVSTPQQQHPKTVSKLLSDWSDKTTVLENTVSKLLSDWSDKTTVLENVASDAYLLSKISFKLLKYLGVGYRWMLKFGALGVYAMLLMPGFIQVGYEYFNDKKIHRNIIYGPKSRNRLDLYVPEKGKSPKPIVVFITGGAWIIGHRAWGCLLGLQLVERDVIVACIDYRNFPQGTVGDMVEDVTQGISFIIKNAAHFGGDTNRIYLAGQSAGAHLAACALLEKSIIDYNTNKGQHDNLLTPYIDPTKEYSVWKASQLKGFFGISGGYNLKELVDYFDNRGLYKSLFFSIMEGEGSLLRFSPELRVQCLSDAAGTMLPDIHLFHGTSDKSIPCSASKCFADVLASYGVHVSAKFYEHKTHTDVFIQDPMRGGHDALLEDILLIVHENDKEAQRQDVLPRRRLVPEFLLQLARVISPF